METSWIVIVSCNNNYVEEARVKKKKTWALATNLTGVDNSISLYR